MQLSGHKNVQSVVNYSSINQEQQQSMSEILSCSESKTIQKQTTSHVGSSPTLPATGTLKLFERATITGGHFNISINTLTSSPIAPYR
jgi:hypothetical protein